MADPISTFNLFLEQNMFNLVIVGGIAIMILIIYKKWQPTPKQPDFITVFHDNTIEDERLNVPDTYEPKWLYRGHQLIGLIVGYDQHNYDNKDIPREEDKFGLYKWSGNITTVIFRTKTFWKFFLGKKQILKFKSEEANIEENKLVFPSHSGFTALGQVYTTKSSYPEVSSIIEGVYSKRLFEANVNLFASKMSYVSQIDPIMSHELNLKKLEIEKIRAEKEKKIGSLI